MKKVNWARIIWVSSIFMLLIVILIMIMVYKIKFQYAYKNKLYFYECESNLCVTEVKNDDKLMYSKYDCGKKNCPIYKKNIDDNYVLLSEDANTILYNYRTGKVISKNYDNYFFINNNYIIVEKDGYHGVIGIKNNLVVPLEYEKIGYFRDDYLSGYNLNYIVAKKNERYGIISFKDGSVINDFNTSEEEVAILIDKIQNELEI